MDREIKHCENCNSAFNIELEDTGFYERIKVPSPRWCPECRRIRRMTWRNLRSLYRRSCGLCGKILISMYPDDGCPVYCTECWNGDGWNPLDFGVDVDWTVPFLIQWKKVLQTTPRHFNYRGGTVVNSDYANYLINVKDVYLGFSITNSENVQHSENVDDSKDIFDCLYASNSNRCLWNVDVEHNFNCISAIQSKNAIDCNFIFDCDNCQNCTLSSNLRNQSYYFRNKKVSKEEYKTLLRGLALNTRSGLALAKKEFANMKQESIFRYANIVNAPHATGDFISNSKGVRESFNVSGGENIAYANRIIHGKDLYDTYAVLDGELQYESMGGSMQSYHLISCVICLASKNVHYSAFCRNVSDCFGCVGLKNKQYCILNKQYSKEEYEVLVPKLVAHMNQYPFVDSAGKTFSYGDFFPPQLSPWGYNETLAYDYFPLREDEAIQKGYNWTRREKREYGITMHNDAIPENVETADESILKEIIECGHEGKCSYQCSGAFRITKEKLSFLKEKQMALPDLCPNCRHYERIEMLPPMKLWHRVCMCSKPHPHHSGSCSNEFETPYAPDRSENVYCEQCYQAEVV